MAVYQTNVLISRGQKGGVPNREHLTFYHSHLAISRISCSTFAGPVILILPPKVNTPGEEGRAGRHFHDGSKMSVIHQFRMDTLPKPVYDAAHKSVFTEQFPPFEGRLDTSQIPFGHTQPGQNPESAWQGCLSVPQQSCDPPEIESAFRVSPTSPRHSSNPGSRSGHKG